MASHGVEKAETPHQRETQLADDYLKSATLARDVAHQALEKTLEELKAGTLRDPAKAAVNAATAGGIMLDKRLILEGRPTQIIQQDDPKRAAQALARRLGVAIEATAEEITAPELEAPTTNASPAPDNDTSPLLSRSVAAKPRARTRAKAPSSAVD